MASVAITESEILDAIAEAARGPGPKEAQTVLDMVDATGFPRARVMNALHLMRRAGRLQVHEVLRTSIDGRTRPVPAYTILPAKKR